MDRGRRSKNMYRFHAAPSALDEWSPSLSRCPPVLLVAFNRPDLTALTFEQVRKARPRTLHVSVDGPREQSAQDRDLVAAVKSIVTAVDWQCDAAFTFHERNLGATRAMLKAITDFMKASGEGVILEDDCLPHSTFFGFAAELLDRYRTEPSVFLISGHNMRPTANHESYRFSRLTPIWGWATWQRAWMNYTDDMPNFNSSDVKCALRRWYGSESESQAEILAREYENPDRRTWGVQWRYTCLLHNAYSVVPTVNLVRNTGMGHPNATKQKEPHPVSEIQEAAMEFPLVHPNGISVATDLDEATIRWYRQHKRGPQA